jgi:polar amino acid transport system substrate-binding protein
MLAGISDIEAQAGTALDRVNAKRILVVAFDPGWPPFSWRDAGGSWSGFDVDVANELAKRIGVKAAFVDPPWDQQTAGHWNGKWDVCVCSMTPTVERARNLDFPAVYYWAPVNLAVNKDNASATKPADLSGKRIGILIPSTYELYLKHQPMGVDGMMQVTYMIDNATIVPFDSDGATFEALAKGTDIDATMNYLPVLLYEIKQGRPLRVIGTPLFYVSDAVAVDKGDPEFSALVKKTVEGMIKDGTIGAISQKWFQVDLSKSL